MITEKQFKEARKVIDQCCKVLIDHEIEGLRTWREVEKRAKNLPEDKRIGTVIVHKRKRL